MIDWITSHWGSIVGWTGVTLTALTHIAPHVNNGEYEDEVTLAKRAFNLLTGNYKNARNDPDATWENKFGKAQASKAKKEADKAKRESKK